MRRRLGINRMRWQEWYSAFLEVVARCDEDPLVLSQGLGYPEEHIGLWQEVWHRHKDSPTARERMGKPSAIPRAAHPADEEDRLLDRLLHAHGYTPASARSFVQEIRDLAFRINNVERRPRQIVTFGVSEAEPPGRSLAEAQLVMVVLDYVAQEDWGLVNRISPQALKWERIKRLCTQAYQQGVALSLADLAHLVGLSVDAVQNTIKEHDQVVAPTRGRVADMGSTLDRLLVLRHFGLPKRLMVEVTGHGLRFSGRLVAQERQTGLETAVHDKPEPTGRWVNRVSENV